MKYAKLVTLTVLATVALAYAAVPQPGVVLYGPVLIGGNAQTSTDTVVVRARINGVAKPIGEYQLGASPRAGDEFVLKMRLESLADGSNPSDDAGRVGQLVQLTVQKDGGAEVPVRDYFVSRIGVVQTLKLDTSIVPANCSTGTSAIDLADFSSLLTCFGGSNSPPQGVCDCADLDGDLDVDMRDWSLFQGRFGS